MSRSVLEWIGASDDTRPPPKVLLRCYLKFHGRCAECGRRIGNGVAWNADHIIALVNGGENREFNLQPLCLKPCHQAKTATDLAEKSTVYHRILKHVGIKIKPAKPMIGSKASGWKRKMDGTLVRR